MKSQYYEAWEAMNKLQEHSSKLNTIKELIDTTIKNTDDENILSLLEATSVILDVYVDEFDDLFRNAWNKTISKGYEDSNKSFNDALDNIDTQNDGVLLNKDSEIKNKIQSSCYDQFYPIGDVWIPDSVVKKEDKVVKWLLPVEYIDDECFISLPEDLLEAANLEEGNNIKWIDNGDGSYLLKKVEVKN